MTLVTISSRPLTVRKAAGRLFSFGADAARPLLEKCGIRANIITAPSWSRAYHMATHNQVDAIMPANKSAAREKIFYFPKTPFTYMTIIAFTHKNSPALTYTGLEMFKGKRLGQLAGTLILKSFKDYTDQHGIKVQEYSTLDTLYEALIQKKITFAVDQTLLDVTALKTLSEDTTIRALDPPLDRSAQYIAIGKSSPFGANQTDPKFLCLMQ